MSLDLAKIEYSPFINQCSDSFNSLCQPDESIGFGHPRLFREVTKIDVYHIHTILSSCEVFLRTLSLKSTDHGTVDSADWAFILFKGAIPKKLVDYCILGLDADWYRVRLVECTDRLLQECQFFGQILVDFVTG